MEERQKKHSSENKEKYSNVGILIVLTGKSGAGKDAVMNELVQHRDLVSLGINRVITCTDRSIREGEPTDAYHFVTPKDLILMEKKDELVEPITPTGTSNKATPKFEIARLLSGENLLWRIDPSRAAEVATGNFFEKHFREHSKVLKANTIVVCINAPHNTIESRRKQREGKNYNPKEFALRDKQEKPHIDILLKNACVIENTEGHLTETVETAVRLIVGHHDKSKNKKIQA